MWETVFLWACGKEHRKFVNREKCKIQNKNCICTVLLSPYYRASLI